MYTHTTTHIQALEFNVFSWCEWKKLSLKESQVDQRRKKILHFSSSPVNETTRFVKIIKIMLWSLLVSKLVSILVSILVNKNLIIIAVSPVFFGMSFSWSMILLVCQPNLVDLSVNHEFISSTNKKTWVMIMVCCVSCLLGKFCWIEMWRLRSYSRTLCALFCCTVCHERLRCNSICNSPFLLCRGDSFLRYRCLKEFSDIIILFVTHMGIRDTN